MNTVKLASISTLVLGLGIIVYSCKKGKIVSTGDVSITDVVKANFTSDVTISTSGSGEKSCIILKSNGLPNHKTPYWGSGNALYEAFPYGHQANANTEMIAQSYEMKIPTNPNEASSKEETSLGEIGMALNGVAIFNDREGGNVSLDAMTLTTFDNSGAHPAPGKNYHYHTTGKYTSVDDAKLIGFLRDGFPIYGRKDTTGVYPSLDEYGGHFGPTQDFPAGIYHYILKSGNYYGTKGTFTK
jgi:hypothetical protein